MSWEYIGSSVSEQNIQNYSNLMLSIAHKQRELLECKFHWAKRTKIPETRKLFFFKAKNLVYEKLLNELEELKQKAIFFLEKNRKENGFFWWNIPWNEVEKYLILDLAEESAICGLENWRFEKKYKTFNEKDHYQSLFLIEEGHYSNFTKKSCNYTNRISSYNEDEIKNKMKSSQNSLAQLDNELYYNIHIDAPNAIIKSRDTGEVYNSIEDYLYSYEHESRKKKILRDYVKTLYTDARTAETYVESSSYHYQCAYILGLFRLKNGIIDAIAANKYKACYIKNEIPTDILNIYGKRNPLIALSAFLADCSAVRYVSNGILDLSILGCKKDINDALCASEFFTCIYKKLKL